MYLINGLWNRYFFFSIEQRIAALTSTIKGGRDYANNKLQWLTFRWWNAWNWIRSVRFFFRTRFCFELNVWKTITNSDTARFISKKRCRLIVFSLPLWGIRSRRYFYWILRRIFYIKISAFALKDEVRGCAHKKNELREWFKSLEVIPDGAKVADGGGIWYVYPQSLR